MTSKYMKEIEHDSILTTADENEITQTFREMSFINNKLDGIHAEIHEMLHQKDIIKREFRDDEELVETLSYKTKQLLDEIQDVECLDDVISCLQRDDNPELTAMLSNILQEEGGVKGSTGSLKVGNKPPKMGGYSSFQSAYMRDELTASDFVYSDLGMTRGNRTLIASSEGSNDSWYCSFLKSSGPSSISTLMMKEIKSNTIPTKADDTEITQSFCEINDKLDGIHAEIHEMLHQKDIIKRGFMDDEELVEMLIYEANQLLGDIQDVRCLDHVINCLQRNDNPDVTAMLSNVL